nr:hypothetical protein [candidate division KSB1 bacterium]
GPTARLYIDGNKIGSSIAVSADPIDVAENGYFAGQEQDAVGGSFNQRQSWAGEMDNLRFYDRVLTEAEIQKLAGEPHSN